MPDDERPEIAEWLRVEPLDDVTRRRLVGTALRESEAPGVHERKRQSRAWQWIGAAAALVVVLVVGLALLSAEGGNDEPQATRAPAAIVPKSELGTTGVGDFGDLDRAANLASLRRALSDRVTGAASSAPAAGAAAAADSTFGSASGSHSNSSLTCSDDLPHGATIAATGTGTLDGRPTTVLLLRGSDGTLSYEAVLQDPCEVRHLR